MKQYLQPVKQLLKDQPLLIGVVVVFLMVLAYVIYVLFNLHPTDLQVAIRYTAFGGTQYYRGKWYYLLNFVAFGIFITVAHTLIVAKLQSRGLRSLAIGFIWLTILLLVVSFVVTRFILQVASLS
jgi:hypothetical protein